jgi:hypothetical protein
MLEVKAFATLEDARRDPVMLTYFFILAVEDVRKTVFEREGWCSPVNGRTCAPAKFM